MNGSFHLSELSNQHDDMEEILEYKKKTSTSNYQPREERKIKLISSGRNRKLRKPLPQLLAQETVSTVLLHFRGPLRSLLGSPPLFCQPSGLFVWAGEIVFTIYFHSSSLQSGLASLDYKSSALTTRPRCLLSLMLVS